MDKMIDNPLTTNVSLALSENGIPYKGLGIGYCLYRLLYSIGRATLGI